MDLPMKNEHRVNGLSGSLVLDGELMAQRRVAPDSVVEDLDVLEDARPRVRLRVVVLVVDQFHLERGIGALHSASALSDRLIPLDLPVSSNLMGVFFARCA